MITTLVNFILAIVILLNSVALRADIFGKLFCVHSSNLIVFLGFALSYRHSTHLQTGSFPVDNRPRSQAKGEDVTNVNLLSHSWKMDPFQTYQNNRVTIAHIHTYIYEYIQIHTYKYIYIYIWSKHQSKITFETFTASIYDSRTDVLVKVSKFLRQKTYRREGVLEHSTFGFMQNALNIWPMRARKCCPTFWNTCSGGTDSFKVKLTFVNRC